MTFFPDSENGTALAATAAVQGFAFERAVQRLIDLTLLYAQRSTPPDNSGSVLHPIVRMHAAEQLNRQPDFGRLALKRWSVYYIAFFRNQVPRQRPAEPYWNTL